MPVEPPPSPSWIDRGLFGLACLLGAMGVTLAAAEAHLAPGTGLQSAALLSLVTAPACLAFLLCGRYGLLSLPIARTLSASLWLGCFLFALSLTAKILGPLLPATHSLSGPTQVVAQIPMLAPFGGSLMIGVWLLAALIGLLTRR